MTEQIPQDPFILLGWVNMKLRDRYASLDELCDDLDVDVKTITERLAAIGMEYSAEHNRFW